MTENPEHRGRLLSAVVIQPNQVLETRKIVPAEMWKGSVARWGYDRWPHAMAVVRAANVTGDPLPHAHDVIPNAYRSFSAFANRGSVVEAEGHERMAAMMLDVREITLTLSKDVQRYVKMMEAVAPDLPLAIKQEIFRLASIIQERVRRGGEPEVRINPLRYAPNMSDLVATLTAKWKQQQSRCALCGGRLIASPTNQMLKPSADRIDSDNGSYDEENVQLTHLACNLAKNEYGAVEFREWLDVVRDEGADETSALVLPDLATASATET